jgi:4-oxalocrotonate tautomerase
MPVIQITISHGRSVEQKRELVKVLTRETARIMKTEEEKIRILTYEVSKENWGLHLLLIEGSLSYAALDILIYLLFFICGSSTV